MFPVVLLNIKIGNLMKFMIIILTVRQISPIIAQLKEAG